MVAPCPGSFERALDKFKASLSPSLSQQFSICSLEDVRDVIRATQQQQGKEGKLRYMRRLGSFLEAMEQFGKVVEVFVNSSEILCFIWGPIKFVLLVARTYLNSFDKILDAYGQVGDAIPGLIRYKATFEMHPSLATVLEDYYSDILRFHEAAVAVFDRPRWRALFHSTWKTFETEFGPVLHSLQRRRDLLEEEKASATLYGVERIRSDILAMHEAQKKDMVQGHLERHRVRVSFIKQKLQAPDYEIDQEMSTEDRHGHSSGNWIFNDPVFQSWYQIGQQVHGVLYVNGIPGAGKTTLISTIIERLMDEKSSGASQFCIAYFYFKHNTPEKETYNGLLRALLEQLINQDAAMSDHLFNQVSGTEGVNLRSSRTLQTLVKTALESYRTTYIVLDGLDECTGDEAAKTVDWFLSLVGGPLVGTNAILRLMFSGQRDGVLDKLLATYPSIPLETNGHMEDIRRYCERFCPQIRQKFGISSSMQEEIVLKVTQESDGMFLYARVVLQNLLDQTKLTRLKEEISKANFPRGIEKAYDRVRYRIFEQSSLPEQEDATRILGMILSARRLINWREIQAFFCIDPAKSEVDYEGRRLRVSCKELCGSLVDVYNAPTGTTDSESMIKIVHETAREYLIRKKVLDTSLENAKLAIFCSQYLLSAPFSEGIREEYLATNIRMGYYSFQEYAVQFCYDHLRQCVVSRPNETLFKEAMHCAQGFLDSYTLSSSPGKSDNVRPTEEVANAIIALPEDGRERNSHWNIELRTTVIRDAIKTFRDQRYRNPTEGEDPFTNLHGPWVPFKCPKPWCKSFIGAFSSTVSLKEHIRRHELPFCCPYKSCFAFQIGFDAHSKLEQHKKHYHAEGEAIEFPMAIPTQIKNKDGPDLYCAAKSGQFEVCKLLLDGKTNINDTGREGHTALHAAVIGGHVDIVHLLLDQEECDADKHDWWGRSPFCYACALGQLQVVQLLLETGNVNVNNRPMVDPESCKSSFGRLTPPGYACIESHFRVVQYLIEEGHGPMFDEEVLGRAVDLGRSTVVNFLLSIGTLNITTLSPVFKALRKGRPAISISILKYMHATGLCVDAGETVFMQCIDLAKQYKWDNVLDAIEKLRQKVIKSAPQTFRKDTSD